MDFTQTPTTLACLALQVAASAPQLPTAPLASPCPLLLETDLATALLRLTSLLLMELVIAMLVENTVKFASIPILAPLAFSLTPRQLTTSASAVLEVSSIPAETAPHALLAAKAAPQPLSATAA